MALEGGQEWLWLSMNGMLGLPLALAAVVFSREIIRSGVALAVGFRVFEIRWGAGRPLGQASIGSIDLAIAPIPLGGSTIARSGLARRHKLAAAAISIAPTIVQLAWLIARIQSPTADLASLSQGFAPLAALDAANALLLAVHIFLPISLPGGIQTDLRLLVGDLSNPAGASRLARASYYARLARQRIENGDPAAAQKTLAQGLVQLGREPLLVASSQRMNENDLSSVVDQGQCSDSIRALIEAAEAKAARLIANRPLGKRVQRFAMLSTPALLATILLAGAQAERLAQTVESRWHQQSELLAQQEISEGCADLADRWARWARRVDRWLPPGPAQRSDRHAALARLEYCRGDFEAAAGHQGEAMLAANSARFDLTSSLSLEPRKWFESELRLVHLFRHAAAVEADRRSYRKSLVAIKSAEQRLEALHRQIERWTDAESRAQAEQSVREERAEIAAMRGHVVASLSGR